MPINTRAFIGISAVVALLASPPPRWAAEIVPTLGVAGRANSTPWVAADGSLVAVAWGAAAGGKTDVFVAISADEGRTFSRPVQVNARAGEARLGGELPPRVAIGRASKGAAPEITVLWTARGDGTTVKVARSADLGKTFGPATDLQAPGAPGDRGWPALTLDGQGRAHAIWLDHRGLSAGAGKQGGHAGHGSGTHDGVAMARKSSLYYAAAGTAPRETEVTNSVCYCCKTALAAAPGGKLFAAWRHVYPGNMRDIALSVSQDGGRRFGAPVRVSEDRWQINGCPDDGPAIAVDGRGTVHLVWPTVINPSNPEGALFYATTRDGRTFSPRTRIPTLGSLKPTHPQIAIDGQGRLAVAWDELVKGKRRAAVRELKTARDGKVEFGAPIMLGSDDSVVYPVLAATSSGLVAVWTVSAGEASSIGFRRIVFR